MNKEELIVLNALFDMLKRIKSDNAKPIWVDGPVVHALKQVKPVPSMVDDTGNYDWPRYYSDPDTDFE